MVPSPNPDAGEPGRADPSHGRPDEIVRFFERGGRDARAAIERLRGVLVAGGAAVEWLVGADRPELHLLVVRGGGPDPDVDAETHCWRFRRCAP